MFCICTSRAQCKNDEKDKHVRYIYDRVAFCVCGHLWHLVLQRHSCSICPYFFALPKHYQSRGEMGKGRGKTGWKRSKETTMVKIKEVKGIKERGIKQRNKEKGEREKGKNSPPPPPHTHTHTYTHTQQNPKEGKEKHEDNRK